MPKKVTRRDSGGRLLHVGEYERKDKGGYEYKRWNPETYETDTASAPTLDELREKEKEIEKDRALGVRVGGKATVNTYFMIWKRNKHIKPNVMHNYVWLYQTYIQPELGFKNIKDIHFSTVQTFYNRLLDKEHLSVSSVDNVHNVLQQILELAVRDDVIRRNPCSGVMAEIKRTRPAPKKREALTIEEQARLLEVLKEPEFKSWRPLLEFMLNTGMRMAEVAGLTWKDIDYEKNLIHIRRNLKYYKDDSEGHCLYGVSTTKTPASLRDIPLTDHLKEILELQKHDGNPCTATVDGVKGFIFGNRFGDPQHQGTVNKAIRRIVARANSEPDASVMLPSFSSHILRHTFCTNMIYAGVRAEQTAALMGHSDITTTMNIYNSVLPDQKQAAMEALARLEGKMEA